ncbi:MAG: hypothetical protein JJE47_07075 [Acidimicrobiia bacterium]|nr:hypothetical protein [Acidimicrobiia bacterium]
MKKLLPFVVLLIISACAEPGPGASLFVPIQARYDQTLDVDSGARLEPGLSVGVWRAERTEAATRLWRTVSIGDEAAAELGVVLDFSNDSVTLTDAYRLTPDRGTSPEKERLDVSGLSLNHADEYGVISGRLALGDGSDVDFWVDTDPESIIEPEIDRPFEMRPGSVIDGSSFAMEYLGIVDDSRCPADVTCIWAGEVSVAFAYVDEVGRTTVTATGLATPDGPIYGTSPTIDLKDSRYLEVLDVTDESVRLAVRSIEK